MVVDGKRGKRRRPEPTEAELLAAREWLLGVMGRLARRP